MKETYIEVSSHKFTVETDISTVVPLIALKVKRVHSSECVYIQSRYPEDFELIGNYLLAEAAKFRRDIDRRAQ